MIDTHCHLDMSPFEADRGDVLSRAFKSDIEHIITVGADPQSMLTAVGIATTYPQVFAAVGIHPHEARLANPMLLELLESLIRDKQGNKIVALGEIGLDYHYNHSLPAVQREVFEKMLSMALQYHMPVIIHNRQADEDTKAIVKASGMKDVLFHCFSSDDAMAKWAIDKGFYVSFAGNVTFKKAQSLRDIASWIPDELLMIETDAPFLAPEPMRGKRNEPSYLQHTARVIAEARGVTYEDINRITSVNAKIFFGIGDLPPSEIVYKIRDNLYINLTSRCTNACEFCVKFDSDFVKGHNLRLDREPSEEEIIQAIGDPKAYSEVVFCGLGEPTLRLEAIKRVAQWVKSQGGRVRLNTNGLGNVINERDIVPELVGLVDALSISLNAQDAETYNRLCNPNFKDAFEEVLDFIKKAVQTIGDVTLTVVETEGVDIAKCRDIANRYKAGFRVRKLDSVG